MLTRFAGSLNAARNQQRTHHPSHTLSSSFSCSSVVRRRLVRPGQYSRNHSLNSIAEMVATAASATVSNVVSMIGTEAGLRIQSAASATKVQRCGLLLSPYLRPRHPFLLAASTSSTRQMRRPSPKRSSTSASNASYRSAMASQSTWFSSRTPSQYTSPPPDC